jgi:hypothetical protein
MKKRDVMGGKGIRNERTRVQAVFLLVTAMRRHQRSFSSDINNMALSVFFVALGLFLSPSLSLSVSSTYCYMSWQPTGFMGSFKLFLLSQELDCVEGQSR